MTERADFLVNLAAMTEVGASGRRLIRFHFNDGVVRSINLLTEPAALLVEVNHAPIHQKEHQDQKPNRNRLAFGVGLGQRRRDRGSGSGGGGHGVNPKTGNRKPKKTRKPKVEGKPVQTGAPAFTAGSFRASRVSLLSELEFRGSVFMR